MGTEHPRVQELRDLEKRNGCAQYRSLPPGKGLGVIYIGIAIENGKMYVGRHAHGRGGRSVQSARICEHVGGRGNCLIISRACAKRHVLWFIIYHLPEEDLDEAEQYLIQKFNTMVPNGYNIKPGGNTAGFSKAQIAKMKATKADPQWKAKHSIAVKAGMAKSTFDFVRFSTDAVAGLSTEKKTERARKRLNTMVKKRQAKLEQATPEEAAKMQKQWARHDRWYQKNRATWSKGMSRAQKKTRRWHKKKNPLAAESDSENTDASDSE